MLLERLFRLQPYPLWPLSRRDIGGILENIDASADDSYWAQLLIQTSLERSIVLIIYSISWDRYKILRCVPRWKKFYLRVKEINLNSCKSTTALAQIDFIPCFFNLVLFFLTLLLQLFQLRLNWSGLSRLGRL